MLFRSKLRLVPWVAGLLVACGSPSAPKSESFVGAMPLTSALAIGQENPFDGVWAVDIDRAGTHILGKRVELRGESGSFYDVQKRYAGARFM